MENFNQLKEKIGSLEADAKAFFEKGNNSAGTRLRVGLQNIKALAQTLRQEVTEKKK